MGKAEAFKPNSDGHCGLEFSDRHSGESQAIMHGFTPRPPTTPVPPYTTHALHILSLILMILQYPVISERFRVL